MNYTREFKGDFNTVSNNLIRNRNINGEQKKIDYDIINIVYPWQFNLQSDLNIQRIININIKSHTLVPKGFDLFHKIKFCNVVNIDREDKSIISITKNITHQNLFTLSDISKYKQLGDDKMKYSQRLDIQIHLPFSGWIKKRITDAVIQFNERNFK